LPFELLQLCVLATFILALFEIENTGSNLNQYFSLDLPFEGRHFRSLMTLFAQFITQPLSEILPNYGGNRGESSQ